jgi:hypothetical protein
MKPVASWGGLLNKKFQNITKENMEYNRQRRSIKGAEDKAAENDQQSDERQLGRTDPQESG